MVGAIRQDMKQLIKDVLEDIAKGQPNLESEAARDMVANLIMVGIKSKGWFLDLGSKGKDNKAEINPNDDSTVYSVVENLGWDAKDKKQTVVGKMTKSEYEWAIGLL